MCKLIFLHTPVPTRPILQHRIMLPNRRRWCTPEPTSSPCTTFCAWTTDDILHSSPSIPYAVSILLAKFTRHTSHCSRPKLSTACTNSRILTHSNVLLVYFIVLQLMTFYAIWILLFNKAIRHWTVYNYVLLANIVWDPKNISSFTVKWFIVNAWWWPNRVETCCHPNHNKLVVSDEKFIINIY